jgi:probable HAF family extracellular repeat protein
VTGRRTTVAGVAAAALLVGMSSTSSATATEETDRQHSYTVVDLGTLGGSFSSPIDVNNRGEVVGVSAPAGDVALRGFIWRHGVMTDFGSLGGPLAAAASVNEAGQVAGWSQLDLVASPSIFNTTGLFCSPPWDADQPPMVCRAVVSDRGRLVDLGTLGGANSAAENHAINDRGQIAGVAETTEPDPTGISGAPRFHATLWSTDATSRRSTPLDLGTLGSDPDSIAVGINDRSQVIGVSVANGANFSGREGRGFLWEKGQKTPLPSLGGHNSLPGAINNRGQIVGFASLRGDQTAHAALWSRQGVVDLGTLPGDTFSEASDITDGGLIVGISCGTTQCRAVRWNTSGAMTDLTALSRPTGQWQLDGAAAANTRGQIVGDGSHNGQPHGYIATP